MLPNRRKTDHFDLTPELLKISRICLFVFLTFVGFGLLSDTESLGLYDPPWIRITHSLLLLAGLIATYTSERFRSKLENLMILYFYSMGIHSFLLLYWNGLYIGYLIGMVLVVTCVGVSFADRRFLIHYLLFSLIVGTFVGIFTENRQVNLALYLPTIFTPVIVSFLTLNIRLSSIESLKESELKLKAYHRRVSEDLETARATQKSLVTVELPQGKDYHISAFYQSFDEVGGDLVSFHQRESGTIELLFGDVSGHGISSAMVSAMAILGFQTAQSRLESPAKSLEYLHKTMQPLTSKHHHISACYLSFDPNKKTLRYSYAGHPPILRLRKDRTIEPLEGRGTLILSLLPAMVYDFQVSLESGDRILCTSDGFEEIFSPEGDFFGSEGLYASILKNWDLKGKEFLESLSRDALSFSNGNASDDMTALLLEV